MSNKSSTPQFIIYALHCPDPSSNSVYVGKSARGMERPLEHFDNFELRRYAHLPRAKFVMSCRKRGIEPEIVVLEVCASADDLNEAEIFHIAAFRAMGMKLLNLTDGGDGVLGHKFTDEARAKMSAVWERRFEEDPGARDRLINQSRGYWAKPESLEKQRQKMLGTKQTPESVAKTSAAHRGAKRSPESKARMAAAAAARWEAPGYREKQVAAQKAAKSSPEAKAKAAEWAKLASKDSHRTPEYRGKQSAAAKKQWDEEARAKKSDAVTRLSENPEYIAKLSKARKLWWEKNKKKPKEDDPC